MLILWAKGSVKHTHATNAPRAKPKNGFGANCSVPRQVIPAFNSCFQPQRGREAALTPSPVPPSEAESCLTKIGIIAPVVLVHGIIAPLPAAARNGFEAEIMFLTVL